jgi:hypothetical protein
MNDVNDQATHHIKPSKLRIMTAAIIAVLAVGYTAVVFSGVLASARQLSAADLVLLVLVGGLIVVILRPETIKEISSLSAAGVRIELNHVQQRQQELQDWQQQLQNFLKEIFPMLLPANVLEHLQNLEKAENGHHISDYYGNDPTRQELRQLRYMGLIRVIPPRQFISQIPDGNFALPEYIELTPEGRHWIQLAPQLKDMTRR